MPHPDLGMHHAAHHGQNIDAPGTGSDPQNWLETIIAAIQTIRKQTSKSKTDQAYTKT